jgi:ABC-type phosphate transport system permease subunit
MLLSASGWRNSGAEFAESFGGLNLMGKGLLSAVGRLVVASPLPLSNAFFVKDFEGFYTV